MEDCPKKLIEELRNKAGIYDMVGMGDTTVPVLLNRAAAMIERLSTSAPSTKKTVSKKKK